MSTAPVVAPAPVLEAVEGAPAKKRGLLIPLIIGVVVLAALGAGAWFFVIPKFFGTAQAKPAAPAEPQVKVTVPLGPVVVNLKGAPRRYLRVNVTLGLASSADAKHVEEHKSQLLDLLISSFSAAEIDTLMSEDGKSELKDDLLERMHDELHLEKILRLYFTEFVIQ
jgi:flagellar FliL protein